MGQYTQAMIPPSALGVLQENDRGEYTLPARGLYPHQWNWDSAFISLGWATVDVDRAYRELASLDAGQAANGMIPHIIFNPEPQTYLPGPDWWGGLTGKNGQYVSGITQPPVAATCLRLLFKYSPDEEAARHLLRSFVAWHHMLLTQRASSYGEPVLIHPWESGRDNAPEWDAALMAVPETASEFSHPDTLTVSQAERPADNYYRRYLGLVEEYRTWEYDQAMIAKQGSFRMLDPGFSSILHHAATDALWLANELGEPQLADMSHQHVLQLTESFRARADAQGMVWALDLATDTEHVYRGAGMALNLLRDDLPRVGVDILAAAVTQGPLSSRFGVRSLARDEGDYDAHNYWRGPVWANISWLCALGLQAHGRYVAAGDMLDAVERFALVGDWPEYIDPEQRSGLGAQAFSWSAALALWIRRPKRERGIALPVLQG